MSEYPWQRLYEAAILEVDRSKLPTLVERARAAIATRLAQADDDLRDEERRMMETAQHGLDVLRREIRTNSVQQTQNGQDGKGGFAHPSSECTR